MAVIGVDSSGKAGQSPIFMVAVRGGKYRCIHMSPATEHDYRDVAYWKYKLSAALTFRAVGPLLRGET